MKLFREELERTKELIANGNIKKALSDFRKLIKKRKINLKEELEFNQEIEKQLINLSSQREKANKKEMLGMGEEDHTINRITNSTLELISEMEGSLFTNQLVNQNKSTKKKTDSSKNENLILFKYDGIHPQKNGWKIKTERGGQAPIVGLHKDEGFGDYIKIERLGSYRMDYIFKPSQFFFKEVSFTANLDESSLLYVNSVLFNKSTGKSLERFWMAIHYGEDYKPPKKYTDTEWIVYASLENLEKGWSKVTLNVPKEFEKIEEMNDWTFERIRAIRLKGNLIVSKIELK